ncbi:MAG: YdcF family protein [Fimbriimonadaceae bacterium]
MQAEETATTPTNKEVLTSIVLGGVLGAGTYVMASNLGIPSALGLDRLAEIDPLWALLVVVPLCAWIFVSKFRFILLGMCAFVTLLFISVALTRIWNPLIQSWPLADAQEFPPFSSTFPEVDAVLVLSSSLSGPGVRDSAGFTRTMAAAPWVGRVPVFLTRLPEEQAGGDATFRYLETLKPGSPVMLIPSGSSTADEAANLREATETDQLKIGVVTTPIHSRRAVETFRKAGFEVVPIIAPERYYDIQELTRPTDRVRAFRDWLPELTASILYRIRG